MKSFVCFLCCLLLVGCVSVGHKIDQAKLDQIKIGSSTRDDVHTLIGNPDGFSKDAATGSEVWTYMFVRSVAKPETYIPIVGAFAGGADTQHQMVMVTFDRDGKVANVNTSFGGSDMKTGANAK